MWRQPKLEQFRVFFNFYLLFQCRLLVRLLLRPTLRRTLHPTLKFGLAAVFLHASFSTAFAQSVEELLRAAGSALSGNEPKKNAPVPKRKSKRTELHAQDEATVLPTAAPTPNKLANPVVASPELSKILRVDAAAELNEKQTQNLSSLSLQISVGGLRLPQGFGFEIDDDSFALTQAHVFPGVVMVVKKISQSPLAEFQVRSATLPLKWTGQVSVAGYFGQTETDRDGIQQGRGRQAYVIAPVGVQGGLAQTFLDDWAFQLVAGLEFQTILQQGNGSHDSGTNFFLGTSLGAEISWQALPQCGVVLGVQMSGLGLRQIARPVHSANAWLGAVFPL